MSDTVMLALIGMIQVVMLAALAIIGPIIISRLGRQKGEIAETKEAIVTLEKNTNSIKDALVKVTGENAFQKGVAVGRDAMRGEQGRAGESGATGEQGPSGPQGRTGPAADA